MNTTIWLPKHKRIYTCRSKYIKKENGPISGLEGLLKKNHGRQKQNQDLNLERPKA